MTRKTQQAANQPEPGTWVAKNIEFRGEFQYRVSIRRQGHPIIHKTFESLKEAIDYRDTILAKIKLGQLANTRTADRLTFGDLACEYLKTETPKKKGASSETYRIRCVVGYTVMPDGTVKVGQADPLGKIVPPQRIASYRLSLCDDTVGKEWTAERKAEGWTEANIARYRNILAAIFSWGITERNLPIKNPFSGQPQRNASKERDRRISREEEAAIVYALESLNFKKDPKSGRPVLDADGRAIMRHRPPTPKTRRRAAFFRLALESACRRGELLRAVWDDGLGNEVNLEEGFIHLAKSKNGDARTIGLSDEAIAVLTELRGTDDIPPGQSVFGFTEDSWKKAWSRAVKAARLYYEEQCALAGKPADPKFLVDLHFHDTRHEAASQLAKVMPELELMKQGGWRDHRSLARYFNPTGAELRSKLSGFRRDPSPHKAAKGTLPPSTTIPDVK